MHETAAGHVDAQPGRCAARSSLAGWIALALACLFPLGATALSVGDPAPAFRLQGSDGAEYTLEGVLARHGGVVLAWFPKAFTPG